VAGADDHDGVRALLAADAGGVDARDDNGCTLPRAPAGAFTTTVCCWNSVME
jgi:hypothetical protein